MRYFDISEFDCKFSGENEMDPEFLAKLDDLREACGFPFRVNSGYRSPDHPRESTKEKPGTHAQGIAADIRVQGGWQRGKIVEEAVKAGFKGIGVARGFVHVDNRDSADLIVWTYS